MEKYDLIEYFDSNGIEYNAGGKEVLTYCPFCMHHNMKLSINADKNVFKCFICDKRGPITSLFSAINSQNSMESVSNNLQSKSIDYLKSRGITYGPESIEYMESSNSVVFPLRLPNGAVVGQKFKSLNNLDENSKYPKYYIKGQNPGLYIPDLESFKTASKVIVVEGEIDALSTHQYLIECNLNKTYCVVASTGIQNRNSIPHILGKDNLKEILICFDNEPDQKGQEMVKKATEMYCKEMRDQLHSLNKTVSISIVKLPIACKDMNDVLQLNYSNEEFLNIINSAEQDLEGQIYRTAAFYLPDMIDFMSDTEKSQGCTTFIDGLDYLLGGGKRLGEISALHAEAKTGKNTLWHVMIHSWLCAGIPVGYCSRELSPYSEVIPNLISIHMKKNMWTNFDVDQAQIYSEILMEWPLYFAAGYGVMQWDHIVQWVRELKGLGVQHFFFDHLHYLLENSEDVKEISMFCRNLKQLAKEENIHVDIIIQPRKTYENQRLSLQSLRGGAAIGQAIDNLFIFERWPEAAEKHISKLTLEVARHKLAKQGEYMFFKYYPETTIMEEVVIVKEKKEEELPENLEIIKE